MIYLLLLSAGLLATAFTIRAWRKLLRMLDRFDPLPDPLYGQGEIPPDLLRDLDGVAREREARG